MQSPQGLEADRGALADVDDEDRMEDQMSQPTAVADFTKLTAIRVSNPNIPVVNLM